MDGMYTPPPITMTIDETYSNWFTPTSGFTVTNAAIRHVERNSYFVYLRGYFETNAIPAHGQALIGNFNLSYFDGYSLSGYSPAPLRALNDTNFYSGFAGITNDGSLYIYGADHAAREIFIRGLFVRQEV